MGENTRAGLYLTFDYNFQITQSFHHTLLPHTFIVNEEDTTRRASNSSFELYNIVSVINNTKKQLELAYWTPTIQVPTTTSTFTIRSESDLPLLEHARVNLTPQKDLLILTSYPPVAGLIKLVKKWKREKTRNDIHVIMKKESEENLNSDNIPDVILAFNIFDKVRSIYFFLIVNNYIMWINIS